MTSTHIIKTPLSIALWDGGGEIEFDAIISFKVHPGHEATWGQPAEGSTVEITRFQIARMGGVVADCPDWLSCRFEADDSFNSWLMQEAAERDEYARDCAAEARAEERRIAL